MTTAFSPLANANSAVALSVEDIGLSLDGNSFVPFYEQIAEQIRSLIRSNKLAPGQSYYSEGEVARALRISKMPVRQAFQKLRAEGLLVIAKGKRPVIGAGPVSWNFQELHGFSEEMRRRGLVPSAKVLTMQSLPAGTEVAQKLRLQVGESIYLLKRLRYIDSEPVAVVTSYLPTKVFPNLDRQDLERKSLYDVIENVYRRKLHRAEEVIGAVSAGEEEARVLEAAPNSALLMITETTFDAEDVAIEYSVSLLRGDRYTATVTSVRKPEHIV